MAAKSNQRRNIVILLALVLLSVLAFFGIRYFNPDTPPSERFEVTYESLTDEIESLEASIIELEVVTSQKDSELELKNRLLDEKYDELTSLAQKIEQLEREGKTSKEEIAKLRNNLSELRGKILDEYKVQIDLLITDNSYLSRAIDSTNLQMARADSIALAMTNEANRAQKMLEDCMGASSMSGRNMPALPTEPILEAVNIRVTDVGGTKVDASNRIGANERIRIRFDLKGNELVPSGEKQIYIVIKNPQGETYVNPTIGEGSGNFSAQGKARPYSQLAKVQFQTGTNPSATVEFEPGAGEEYLFGNQTIELYYQGKAIGTYRVFFNRG